MASLNFIADGAGTTTLVSAGGSDVKVNKLFIWANTLTAVPKIADSGPNDLLVLPAAIMGATFSSDTPGTYIIEAAAGEDLTLVLAGAGRVGGHLDYEIV